MAEWDLSAGRLEYFERKEIERGPENKKESKGTPKGASKENYDGRLQTFHYKCF